MAKFLGGGTPTVPSHAPLFYIRNELGIGHFAFGVVRDPWDRLVSLYTFICTKQIRTNESAAYHDRAREMGFRAWLLDDRFFIHEDRLWRTEDLPPMQQRSQGFWLEGCDEVCRLESLEDDLGRVLPRLDIRRGLLSRLHGAPKLPHRNRSSHGDPKVYYDAETRDFVAHHFAWEIERFGYSFD